MACKPQDVQLTPHFNLREFAVSAQHPELVEPVPEEYVPHVVQLAATVLQPLRDALGRPIRVNSGYRSPALNVAVGGSPTSQHLRAEAADIVPSELTGVFTRLILGHPALPVGQVILYPSRGFLHVALPSARYPAPSFHVHEPSAGFRYRRVRSVAELKSILRELER